MHIPRPQHLASDAWGGMAAMLVALPSAIAFGVTIFAPLGGSYAAQGALAGILGATALGLIASTFGGTLRLISAPCAPAAAVLSAFAIERTAAGIGPDSIVLMLTLVALIAGALQLTFGALGLGRMIKYMPYPVVSGYLTGVGLIIIGSQVPKWLGLPKGPQFWTEFMHPDRWRWQGVLVGVVAMAVMVLAPRFTKKVPAAILGLTASVLAYFALAQFDPALLHTVNNPLVVGPLSGNGAGGGAAGGDAGFLAKVLGSWSAIVTFEWSYVLPVLVSALTLAVLLSIDTLKTCVVLDALTRTRHDSNRELIGQGLGNLSAGLIGGIPGAGTMGATLVNMSSGGLTRWSSVIEGGLALGAFLLLGSVIAWVPIAALAGILIVIGVRMADAHALDLLKSRSTMLDFAVIVAVVVTAVAVSLIWASSVGVVLAIFLFFRKQVGGSIIRHQTLGKQMFSKQVRLPEQMAILERDGERTIIIELQGNLFFGTTDQLYSALEAHLKIRDYVVLDLRRVQSIDVTAAHMLAQLADMLNERSAYLLFSQVPRNLPTSADMLATIEHIGLNQTSKRVELFAELDGALEWIEEHLLAADLASRALEKPLLLNEIALFSGRKAGTLAALENCVTVRSCAYGERIFARGERGDEIYFIRQGHVRIELPLVDGSSKHLATFNRGDFFGEMAFLDQETRSADAIAAAGTELYVLSRQRFDALASEHKNLAIAVLEGIARVLAIRLRYANTELAAL